MQRGLLLVVTAVCLDFGLTYATIGSGHAVQGSDRAPRDTTCL